MTHPGTPGSPPLESPAQQALAAARARVGSLTRPNLPPPPLSRQERDDALREAGDGGTCRFCASLHPGANSPACPRIATFKLNGDGDIVEGSFWPEGVTDVTQETRSDGTSVTVTHVHSEWDTSKVVPVADLAEDGDQEEPDA